MYDFLNQDAKTQNRFKQLYKVVNADMGACSLTSVSKLNEDLC